MIVLKWNERAWEKERERERRWCLGEVETRRWKFSGVSKQRSGVRTNCGVDSAEIASGNCFKLYIEETVVGPLHLESFPEQRKSFSNKKKKKHNKPSTYLPWRSNFSPKSDLYFWIILFKKKQRNQSLGIVIISIYLMSNEWSRVPA